MIRALIKKRARRFYWQILSNFSFEYEKDDLKRRTIVFSPHFDDETLGCGGTILKKRKAGADVKIVFMTDGSKSHTHLMSEEDSKVIRRGEGLAACRSLGLNIADVFFLDFEETKLREHLDSAIHRVKKILNEVHPEEVFIPYSKEPLLWSEDHLATTKIVKSGLRLYNKKVIIYEYPIWFWCHWPWAKITLRRRREIFRHLKNHSFIRGINLLWDFRCRVGIGDILDLKQNALKQHKSQMTRFRGDPRWRILADVSNGEFLSCFFQEYELFHKYIFKI